MKLQLCFKFLVLLSSLIMGERIKYTRDTYGSITASVRDYYGASTVFLVHTIDNYGDYRDLQVTYIIHTLIRILGRHRIVALNFHFKRMTRIRRYYDSIVRPLILVLFTSMKDVLEFAEITKSFRMSFPVWLLIFLPLPGADLRDFCENPQGNPFHLVFDIEMLVLCDSDNTIREWYSIERNRTRTFELARWDTTKGFVLLTDLPLFKRRNSLNGTTLRAVVVKDSAFMDFKDGHLRGFFGEIFSELSQAIDLSVIIVNATTEFGSWHSERNMWTGAIAEVISGRADMGISDFSMSPNRIAILDYTIPLIMTRNSMYIMQSEIFDVQWFAYFKAFHYSIWISIIMTIVAVPFFLVFLKTRIGSYNIIPLICDNFLYVWGIFCQQSMTEFPEYSSLRVAYVSIFIMATVISAAYSASLICFLTACIPCSPFSSIDEFVKDGSFKLVTVRDSADYDMFANTNDTLFQQIMSLMVPEKNLPSTMLEAFEYICRDSRAVLYTNEAVKKMMTPLIPCKVAGISAGRIDSLSMVLSKHNPYTAIINNHLRKFLTNGVLQRYKGYALRMNADREITYQPVELFSVAPVLAILSCGIFLGALILFAEKYYYKHKHGNDKNGLILTSAPKIGKNSNRWTAIARRAELQ